MSSGIYMIYNTVNSKFYIGSAVNFKNRWSLHLYHFTRKSHQNRYLQNAWNKYGDWFLEFYIIEYCDREKLEEREQWWLDLTKCYDRLIGYNLYKTSFSPKGMKFSKETIEKRASKLRGIKRDPILMANLAEFNRGKPKSEETKRKIGLAGKGRQTWLGKTHTQESKNKISKAKFGKKHTEEHKMKIRKIDRWPCEDGHKCKCEDCKGKRAEYMRNYKKVNYIWLN